MREIYVIGTLHAGYTPNDELRELLEDIEPNQVLVELPDEPIEELKDREVYPSEMIFAYNWGKEKGLQVGRFDVESDYSYFNEGRSPDDQEYKDYLEYQESIIKEHSWKDFNKERYNKLLDHPLRDVLFDKQQAEKREAEMLENIKKAMISNGKIVVTTGAGHLNYLQEHLPEAVFPLRD